MILGENKPGCGPGKWLGFSCVVLAAFALGRGVTARAEGIGGYLDLNYSNLDTETRDAVGSRTKTKSGVFNQRYRLSLNKKVFPTVTWNAGGTFERTNSTSETDSVKTDSLATRLQPFIDLSLNTPLVTAGAGYLRTESKSKSNDVSSPTLVREQPSGRFGYKPDGFPTLDLQFTRTQNYDSKRTAQDTVADLLNVNSRYNPIRDLQIVYQGSFDDFTDRLKNNESRNVTNSGTVTYSGRYWKNRMTFTGSYNISQKNTEVITGGKGELSFLLSPFFGLSTVSDTPLQVILPQNPALVDGATVAGSGVDIGLPPPLGDTRPRNLGLDFVLDTEVNTLFVWVDKRLPPSVANSYSWGIYSSDNNQDWTLRQTVSPALFAPFDNRFEINFQNVTARYIKVVTRPLTQLPLPTADDPNPALFRAIQVTELQAFHRKSAATVGGKSSQTSQILNLDARVRLLDVPSLYYEITYFRAEASLSPARSTVTNALSTNQQFNRVFSGSGRVSREDSDEQLGRRVAYTYAASLTAVPLPTLTHNLTFSGRREDLEGKKSDSNSVFVNNSAEIYKGIHATLSGGFNIATFETGVKNQGTTLVGSLDLVPHRALSINMAYNGNKSTSTGGGKPDITNTTSTGEIGVTFKPIPTLYLFGDWVFVRQPGQPWNTTQNYALNWSPFPEGTVHFNFGYNEVLQSSDQSKNRTIIPSIRWNINPRTTFDAAYQWARTETPSQDSRSNVFSTNLRVNF